MKRVLLLLSLPLLLVSLAAAVPPPGTLVVDGSLGDWPSTALRVDDPAGDAQGPTDVLSLAATRLGDHLYLRLEIAAAANLMKPADGGGLRLEVRGADDSVTIDTGLRQAERNGRPVPWTQVDYVGLPTYAATEFELRLRAPEGPLQVMISGSDSLDGPLVLESASPAPPPPRLDIGRGDAPLRVVVWNVLQGGPFKDPEREADGRKVLETLDPDVLLLQEVWEIPNFDERVRALCGEEWTVFETGGVAVASRFPLTLLEVGPPGELDNRRRPRGGDSWSVMRNLFVGVDSPIGPIVVVSAHWRCCGEMGSSEDISRMDDALGALKGIWRLRDAAIPASPRNDGSLPHKAPVPERFAAAPLLVAGDYNLVGSRTPLDMLLTQGLIDLVPLQSDEWIAATWRSVPDERLATPDADTDGWEPGGFPHGRLDLALADPRLNIARAFVADLGEITLLSDHLPIVLDLGD